MKRYVALLPFLALMFSFSGCGRTSSPSFPEVSLPPATLSIWEKSGASFDSADVSEGLGNPINQSAEELIGPVLEIYSWFALGSMPLAEQTRVEVNPETGEEETFQLVDSPYFSSYAQMKDYLSNFFSEEITSQLLEQYPVCKDIDGALYMLVPQEIYVVSLTDITFSVEESTDSSVRLSATVSGSEDLAKNQRYEFVCQKVDGKWIFTTFAYDW